MSYMQRAKKVKHHSCIKSPQRVGVYSKAVHMLELDLLLKTRCKEYWKERLADERVLMLKQSKEHWKSQSTYAI